MGFRDEAIEMYKEFRVDEDFKDAFYPASWSESVTSSGGAFGGGTVTTVSHESVALLMGNKDIKKVFQDGVDMKNKFIKVIIDEFGRPKIGSEVIFNGSKYTAVQLMDDSVGALLSIELKV